MAQRPLIVCEKGGGFYRFKGLSGGGAAHKNREAPRSFRTYGIHEKRETCEPFEPV